LIAIFTGMRRSEICQLNKSDVVVENGIKCIRVGDGENGQLIKSDSSRRLIPIHSELIRLGFQKFVEETAPGPLFPELKPSKVGDGFHVRWRWFDRAVAREVNQNPGKSFYSIRYSFAEKLTKAGVPSPVRFALLGRQNFVDASLTSSQAFPLIDVLHDVVEKIAYDGVSLEKVMVYLP